MKNKRAFTLIELIVVLVILAIIALIVTPLVLNIIDKVTDSANKRSIDAYGKAIELAMQSYKLEHGKFTYDINELNIEYSGNKVECDEITLNENGSVFITKCKIDGEYVEDEKTSDGYYQYGGVIFDYAIGDIVTYNNMKYYVISNSNPSIDYVTLLKAEPLTVDEVNTYGVGHVNMYVTYNTSSSYYQKVYNQNGYGGMAYYSSATCGYPTAGSSSGYTTTGCTIEYAQSEIKYVVDSWASDKLKSADLKEDSLGYKARLITFEELTTNLGYDKNAGGCIQPSTNGDTTPEWVYNSKYYYWTISPYQDSSVSVWIVGSSGSLGSYGINVSSSNGAVRPVINLRKSAIE